MRTSLRLAVLTSLLVGALAAPSAIAEAIVVPGTLYHERPVGIAAVDPDFPVEYVGVVFDLPPGADAHHAHEDGDDHGAEGVAVRFRHAGRWGDWQPVPEDGAQAVGQWTGALVRGDGADAYQVRGVPAGAQWARAAALNTTDGPERVVGYRHANAAEAATNCKARVDWGADETIRTSTRAFAPMQIATVHHTATQNDDPDPDARVRAIYEYHVKTNRWDDIGYQALISEDGTVYEGRWSGGDSPSCAAAGGGGWEFGHETLAADAPMVTGAHTGGYNTGNFGVALLGTLTDVGPTAGARGALVEYLAQLFERHGLDPNTEVVYDNGTNSATVWTISGHQDFVSTECPGGTMYTSLPVVRADVAARVAVDDPPVVTITTPSEASSITLVEDSPGAGASVTFGATAFDEDTSTLSWAWSDGAAVVGSSSTYSTTLAIGAHSLTVTATDAGGQSHADTISVEVVAEPTHVDDRAGAETAVSGSVSGTYLDTWGDDGVAESITEVESGGRPASRHSLLEHRWSVDVTGGTAVTLVVDAATSISSDGDGFEFAYSTDGASFTPVLTISADGATSVHTAALPASTVGAVTIRVTDTDRSPGNRSLDRISVDQLLVRSETSTSGSEPTAPEEPAPATIELEASGRKVKGERFVDLRWTGDTHVDVYRHDGTTEVLVARVSGSDHTDAIPGNGGGSFTHRVCSVASPSNCSNSVTTTF